jgi:hypothetical protein
MAPTDLNTTEHTDTVGMHPDIENVAKIHGENVIEIDTEAERSYGPLHPTWTLNTSDTEQCEDWIRSCCRS